MKEALDDRGAFIDQHPFELVDVAIPARPDRLGNEFLDPGDEHVLVLAPIEDPDISTPRGLPMNPPEVVVVQVFGSGTAEGMHVDAVWIHPGEDRSGGAVLARGVEALENDQQ